MARVVVLGSFNMDLTVFAPSLPKAGETVLGSSLLQNPGGKGSNQAIAAARLGASVCFVGAVGHDAFGNQAMALHEAEGIDTAGVSRSDASTGTALIVVDAAGENQIAVASGANVEVTPDLVERAASSIREADLLVAQLETPIESFIAAATVARESDTMIVLNPAPAAPIPDAAWPLIDVLVPNEHELAQLSDHADPVAGAEAIRGRGPNTVVVTQGANGVLVVSEHETFHRPARQVEAVDTTGAGDAFTAALSVALAEGRSLNDAVDFALRVGAHAVTVRGVLDALPFRDQMSADG